MSNEETWSQIAARGGLPSARDIIDLGKPPRWTNLAPNEAQSFPYAAVGPLFNQNGAFVGTGWLIGTRTGITAAHCTLFGNLQLALSGEPATIPVAAVAHPQFADHGPDHLDPHDIAVFQLNRAVAARSLRLGQPASNPVRIELVGCPKDFQGQILARQEAAGRLSGDGLLLHQADSTGGHSGAPVLVSGPAGDTQAVAVHVGGFSLNPHGATIPRHNTALLLQGDLGAFVSTHLRQWG
jgi:V8-like Glu-specific endopeptidase